MNLSMGLCKPIDGFGLYMKPVRQVGERKTFWNEPVDEPALGLQNLSMGL